MKKFLRFSVGVFALLFLAAAFVFRVDVKEAISGFLQPKLPPPKTITEFLKPQNPIRLPKSPPQKPSSKIPLPSSPTPPPSIVSINLNIPFASQAPFGDWGLPYQEACEEAAVIMAHRFFSGETLDPPTMDAEIRKLVEWQNKTFGYYKDTTAEEIARMLREYFGQRDVEVRYEFTIEDIKHEVSQGNPVILPAAGRLLPNPYFRQPGPVYHALVVKGFIGDKIITNDPGTRRGKDFLYDPDPLMNAIHDWDPLDILKGRKAIVVVKG